MSTIDRSLAELANALTFGVSGDDSAAHAARGAAAQAALTRHSEQLDRAYASAGGQVDPWFAPPFGADLVAGAGGDLDAVLASPAFVPEVQREAGLAADEEFVHDEDGERWVQFTPEARHVDEAYECARAVAAQLIERGDASPTAVVGAGRTYGDLLMLTAEQRTTVLDGIREIGEASGDADGRFAAVAEYVERHSELPQRADLRDALVTVFEGQLWTEGARDVPDHLHDLVAEVLPGEASAEAVEPARDGRGLPMLTAEQRTTLLEAIDATREASGDTDGRFAFLGGLIAMWGEVPERPDLREALATVLEGQFGTPSAPDLPEHLREVVDYVVPDEARGDSHELRPTDGMATVRSEESATQLPSTMYSPREFAEREMLRAAGINPDERAAQPVPSSQAMMLQPEVQRTRGDDPLER
ncbi:hypothetical protein [Clavibacter michiganensis]|uniref:Uncharacterized protein n=1 Tax=Clavibacter michiganensis subsp. insidiosus TaxID=33014 RepID=A0A399SQA6_9MICO|nr:hypothetical protein [Clavibacter michiganensis]AWF99863.1 hypothetical protein BEH61_15260 [Clavibacter michiganensis subsp. insidiosus]OQJ57022.1 hypothetical protein B5P21_15740 [Clavibacter michiganensis subsp. insidiosus]RIJ44552.1 hypothetical protein DZF93_02390 [Clavibacter michiganensis subsp. insidiosus]RMC83569.1 hypothetical protein CmiCFBP2404_14765 [Clavibacter michiganensis subsp. insidiosus]